jgi:hypothetical protein
MHQVVKAYCARKELELFYGPNLFPASLDLNKHDEAVVYPFSTPFVMALGGLVLLFPLTLRMPSWSWLRNGLVGVSSLLSLAGISIFTYVSKGTSSLRCISLTWNSTTVQLTSHTYSKTFAIRWRIWRFQLSNV